MHLGLHLPQLDLDGSGFILERLTRAAGAARDAGFGSVSANDHLVFSRPWLDGLVALTAVVEASGDLELMTTVAVPALRHPVVLAKTLTGLDTLSGGRVVAGVGAGSSRADYEAVGVPFEERWRRLDDAAVRLRPLLGAAIPLWLASWGSPAGLRRVERHGDGWLASAYNTDPDAFAAARSTLPAGFPAAVVTMWTWVTDDDTEAERMAGRLAPALGRDPGQLRDRVCIGSAQRCAELVARYAEVGCDRIHFWPLGDEERQVELIAGLVPGTAP